MAESLPPSGHRYNTRKNTRKRSLEADDNQRAQPADDTSEKDVEEEPCTSNPAEIDCAICLQTCVHPARLPCGHIFCYLCLKGIFRSCAKCAMCRRPIPRNYLETPDLLELPTPASAGTGDDEEFHWYYEGRHGWWEYDPRANNDLETAYQAGESKVELLIANYVYLVDLHGMMQYRKSDPGRRRAVKRDRVGTACKGVAGIRPTVLQAMGDLSQNRSDSPNDGYSIEEAFGDLSLSDDVQLYIHVESDISEDVEELEVEEDDLGDDDEGYD